MKTWKERRRFMEETEAQARIVRWEQWYAHLNRPITDVAIDPSFLDRLRSFDPPKNEDK
jgi:hypothetical protein